MFKLLIIFGFASTVTACGSIGGGTDGQIYQNPTLEWRMNPPAAWTYPEPHAPLTQVRLVSFNFGYIKKLIFLSHTSQGSL
jgi:hypothetical protein